MKPVWIVDDDRSIRWVFEKALTRENIAFRTFSSADDALGALASETPQLVVSDIRMPGESGLALLQQAKQRFPHLPVIIMTAYSDLESAVAAFQGGAYEYLPKPFDVDHAVELIRRAMEESTRGDDAVEAPGAEPEILDNAHLRVERDDLGHVPELCARLEGLVRDVVPGDPNGAAREPEEPRDHAEGRALSCAVRTEEPDDLAAIDLEREVVHGQLRAVALHEVLDRDHGPSLPS